MSSPTIDEQGRASYSVNALAKMTKLDRRTVEKYLEAEGVEGKKKSNGTYFPWLQAIQAFIFCSKGQSSADRRNEAQAKKAEVETAILERRYIPINEIQAPIRSYFSALNAIVQQSELSDDEKERLFEKAQDLAKKIENLS